MVFLCCIITYILLICLMSSLSICSVKAVKINKITWEGVSKLMAGSECTVLWRNGTTVWCLMERGITEVVIFRACVFQSISSGKFLPPQTPRERRKPPRPQKPVWILLKRRKVRRELSPNTSSAIRWELSTQPRLWPTTLRGDGRSLITYYSVVTTPLSEWLWGSKVA